MVFVACGLNHKTAPLTVREKIARPPDLQQALLHGLAELPAINEAALLSTCNRTEIYCETDDPDSLLPWLMKEHGMEPEIYAPHFYVFHGHQGVRHTMRVASGLDSMMPGEPQILGQMKEAYRQACRAGTVKSSLRMIFEYIFSASRRIRNESGIGSSPVSIAYAAAGLIKHSFSDMASIKVFLIGSGETATLVAKYLQKQGVQRFRIAGRSSENSQKLAQILEGEALNIGDIPQYLHDADVVITATACPLPFINKNMVEQALARRHGESMFFLDLSVPRDIEANVVELDPIQLYNIDDLQHISDGSMKKRRSAALTAEQLVDCELDNYIRRHRSLQANQILCDYRNHIQSQAEKELQRARNKLSAGCPQDEVMQELCSRMVHKFSHGPTVGLKQAAADGREDLLPLIQYLYDMDIA